MIKCMTESRGGRMTAGFTPSLVMCMLEVRLAAGLATKGPQTATMRLTRTLPQARKRLTGLDVVAPWRTGLVEGRRGLPGRIGRGLSRRLPISTSPLPAHDD